MSSPKVVNAFTALLLWKFEKKSLKKSWTNSKPKFVWFFRTVLFIFKETFLAFLFYISEQTYHGSIALVNFGSCSEIGQLRAMLPLKEWKLFNLKQNARNLIFSTIFSPISGYTISFAAMTTFPRPVNRCGFFYFNSLVLIFIWIFCKREDREIMQEIWGIA